MDSSSLSLGRGRDVDHGKYNFGSGHSDTQFISTPHYSVTAFEILAIKTVQNNTNNSRHLIYKAQANTTSKLQGRNTAFTCNTKTFLKRRP